MNVYRIALTQYSDAAGEGAKLYGGRWNRVGQPAIYAGASISNSLLERLTIDPELFSSERYVQYSVMEIDIPDEFIFVPKKTDLLLEWDKIPAVSVSQEFGANLLLLGKLCFAIPSVIDKSSMNYVINPLSEKFHLVKYQVYPLELDQRIVR